MGGLLAALATLAAPMTARVLMALGMSVVTVTGVTLTVDALKAQLIGQLGTMPAAALQLVGLAGGWVGLGMLLGAMTWCASFWALTQATRIIGVGNG